MKIIVARRESPDAPFVAEFRPTFREWLMPLSYFSPAIYILLYLANTPFWSLLTFTVFLTLALLNSPSSFTLTATGQEVLVKEVKYGTRRRELTFETSEVREVQMHWQDASNPFKQDGELNGHGGRKTRSAGYRLLIVGKGGYAIGACDPTRHEAVLDAMEDCGRELAEFLGVDFEKVIFVSPRKDRRREECQEEMGEDGEETTESGDGAGQESDPKVKTQ